LRSALGRERELLWRDKFDEAIEHLRQTRDDAKAAGDVLTDIRGVVYQIVARRRLGDVEGVRALEAELSEFDDTYGCTGLICANRAWLAQRQGDLDATEAWGAAALADWPSDKRAGPTVFQWTARFPLLAVDVARDRLDSATEHARAMLDEAQQPLTTDVQAALEDATRTRSRTALAQAIGLARRYGYT
jgi:hypothetical protein